MKIYLASSWRNDLQPALVMLLRKHGHQVYDFRNPAPGERGFAWSEIDKEWRSWTPEQYIEYLTHPYSEKGFKLDFDGMQWADACVLLLPSGRSAHIEGGWMKGAGKKLFIVMQPDQEPELMYKIADRVFRDIEELILYLDSPGTVIHPRPRFTPGADEKKVFDGELKELGDLYEEAKDCLHSMSILNEEMDHRDRLYEILRELRDRSAVQLKNIYAID